jgi:polyhydroxyalkanoate synthase
MKAGSEQYGAPPWMAQFTDPSTWQSLLNQPATRAQAMTSEAAKNLAMSVDPEILSRLQAQYMQDFAVLWQDLLASRVPALTDKRFSKPAWQSNPLHAFNAAAYLLNARYLLAMADSVKATPKARQKLKFSLQQTIDAMSPANFLVTNPEAQQKIVETKGESLARGMAHMLGDLQKGHISQTDESAFEVGKNVATSEGAVVFENELFQLIQYKPLTRTVYERPLLLVPPCINKFYIMDLQPSNSLVRFAVSQGHTVFLVSWRNADASCADMTWDDYIEDGAMKAIEVVQSISGEEKINALGFCVGGTILATALAVLYGRGENPVASVTLLTALLDFSDTGALDVYIDEAQVSAREVDIGKSGLMPGRDFATAFSSLRPNDLVWNYVESNYLKGEEPPAFDLLYWNADSTNLPGPMFCWYLRNLYLEDRLKVPGKLTVAGEKVDLGKINAPAFLYASREDHIVLINRQKPSQNQVVLGASGHIAGVINPPEKKKRSFWSGGKVDGDAAKWMEGSAEQPGSWWPTWAEFLARHAGKEVPAPRRYGSVKFKPTETAPGRYVK